MRSERVRTVCRAALVLLCSVHVSRAEAGCDPARAVTLEIHPGLIPSDAARLERSLISELGESRIAVCSAPPGAATPPRVQISAIRPGWARASIRLQTPSGPLFERELDVSTLPPEARPLAIASATDELLRSTLDEPGAAGTRAPGAWGIAEARLAASSSAAQPSAPPSSGLDRPASGEAARAPHAPLFELGLGVGGASYPGQLVAVQNDVLVRYWLSPDLALSANVGLSQRLSRPPERGAVQPDEDLHAALGAGVRLWGEPAGFALLGAAAVQVSRVAFDERRAVDASGNAADGRDPVRVSDDVIAPIDPVSPIDPNSLDDPRGPARSFVVTQSSGSGWGLAGSLGLEGRAQRGRAAMRLSLAALFPLVPARPDGVDRAGLDAVGVQARFDVSIVLGSRPALVEPLERAAVGSASSP